MMIKSVLSNCKNSLIIQLYMGHDLYLCSKKFIVGCKENHDTRNAYIPLKQDKHRVSRQQCNSCICVLIYKLFKKPSKSKVTCFWYTQKISFFRGYNSYFFPQTGETAFNFLVVSSKFFNNDLNDEWCQINIVQVYRRSRPIVTLKKSL